MQRIVLLASVAFAAFGRRVKIASAQDGSYATHQETQNADSATRSSHSLAELEHLQSHARAGAPDPLKWLAMLLMAGNSPTDALPLPKFGRGQLASHVSMGRVSGGDFVRGNYQTRKSTSAKLAQLHQKEGPQVAEKFNLLSGVGDPMLEDTLLHLLKTPIRLQSWTPRRLQSWSPAMNSAVLPRPKFEFDSAPPAPPPPPRNSGGGDGSGGEGGGPSYIHFLQRPQAMELLNDWIARTRIYSMSDQFGTVGDASVAEVHRKSLENLEELLSLSSEMKPKVLIAMSESDNKTMLAFAACDFGWYLKKRPPPLVIQAMSVSPAELNEGSSEIGLLKLLKDGLQILATGIGVDLIDPDDNDSALGSPDSFS